jgi:hypothetical protein
LKFRRLQVHHPCPQKLNRTNLFDFPKTKNKKKSLKNGLTLKLHSISS